MHGLPSLITSLSTYGVRYIILVWMIIIYAFMGLLLNKVSSIGRDGLTHNMLNDIHNNWKNAEAVRIKCLGVPTVDMENVCTQLEVYFLLILFLQLPWSKHVTYVIDSSFVILINYLCQQLSLSTYIMFPEYTQRNCFLIDFSSFSILVKVWCIQ